MKLKSRMRKMLHAAELAGRIQRRYFGQELVTRQKSIAADLQTRADLE